MSSTTGSQNLLTNIFRPAYRYEIPFGGSTATFTPTLDVSNIDVLTANSVTAFSAAIGDDNENVYVGLNAGNAYSNLRGCSNNTAVGFSAANFASNVANSIYIGYNAGAGAADSSVNIAIGPNTKGNGISNIYIGSNTGSLGTGSNNILIGHNLTGSNMSNMLLIGPTPTIYGNLSTRRVGIGRDPSHNMDVSGTARITSSTGIGMAPNASPFPNVPHILDVSGYSFMGGNVGINSDPADYTLNVNGSFNVADGVGSLTLQQDGCGNSVFTGKSYIPGKKFIFNIVGDICASAFLVPGASFTGNVSASNFIATADISGPAAHITTVFATTVSGDRVRTIDISGTNATFSNLNVGSLVAGAFAPSNIVVPGYVRDELVPVTLDISGGNISNSATTRSGNFISPVAGSNSLGGVVLSNNNITNSGTHSTVNLLASGYVRNALVPTQFDISGGNISNSATHTSSNFIGTATASNSIGGVTLSNTNLTLAGTITGSTANTSNVIGGVVLSNNNISNSGTTTTANILASGYVRNALAPTEFDISGGRIRMAVGSVSNPSYGFLTDPSSGLYMPSASNLSIATAGVERLRVTSGGLIGINTSNPATAIDVSNGVIRISSGSGRSGDGIEFVRGSSTFGADVAVDWRLAHDSTGALILAGSNTALSNQFMWFGTTSSSNPFIAIPRSLNNTNVPALIFSASGVLDTDTGVYSSTANQVGLIAGGGGVVCVSSNFIGINTEDPRFSLDVCGNTRVSGVVTAPVIRNALVPTEFDISGGRIRSAVGSVSNPAFGFLATDISAGLYLAASNRLGVAVGGTARLLIDNSSIAVGTPVSATKTALFEIGGGYNPTGTAAARSFPAIAFQYGDATLGGFRHFIRARHSGAADNCNAIDFFMNNSTGEGTSVAPGVGNVLAMSVTGTGVGIGTSAPTYTLDISSSTVDGFILRRSSTGPIAMVVSNTVGSTTFGTVQATGNFFSDSSGGDFAIRNNSTTNRILLGTGTTANASTICISNQRVGIGTSNPTNFLHIQKGNYNNQGNNLDGTSFGIQFGSSNFTDQAKILAYDKTSSGGAFGGGLAFHTGFNGSSEKMRINPDGNVGIGNNNPQSVLDVNGMISFNGSGLGMKINMYTTAGGILGIGVFSGEFRNSTDNNGTSITWGPYAGTTFTEQMRLVTSTGRLGIGSNNPGYRLDVVADATSNAAVNMSTWHRSAVSLSHIVRGTISNAFNGGGSLASFCLVFNTPSVALDTNLGTITNDSQYGTYFVCRKSGIWQIGLTIHTGGQNSTMAIDTSTNLQDNANPGDFAVQNRSLGYHATGYFSGSVHYTGYLPSNANRYYKFKCNNNNLASNRERALLQITFLGEQPTAAGSWPL